MRTGERVVLGLAGAVLAAGVAAAATVTPARSLTGATTSTTAAGSPPTTGAPASTTLPGGPGPSSAALSAGMLAPVDLGGFYRVDDPYAATLLSTSPCLAGAGPSQAQNGRAFRGLIVPGGHPAVAEVAASYPGSTAEQVYQSVSEALRACTAFAVTLAGGPVTVHIASENMPAVGDASSAFGGTFTAAGRAQALQLEVVLDGKIVLVVVYVDSVPATNAIYGDLPSTVSAAIGKLA